MAIQWQDYPADKTWDELICPSGRARKGVAALKRMLGALDDDELKERKYAAELAIRSMGITFTVYSGEQSDTIDREWPFDIIPRLILKTEWDHITKGLIQRVKALNCFIDDIYHQQSILKDGIIPRAYIEKSNDFRPECMGISPTHDTWSHVCGSDLVRDDDGKLYVLEDNLRVPSGVSYMLENREVMKRVFPELFTTNVIHPVNDYPAELAKCLRSLNPNSTSTPQIAVLTPGIYNAAYFEHTYLANAMAAELVEGRDLEVGKDEYLYMRTIRGLVRVDVLYRRIDDTYLDPEVFNADSTLGVAGIMRAWRAGKVALANAPGCGVADDKVIYTYVPDIIRYYLNESPLLSNVPSYRCVEKQHRDFVLDNLDKLVVKPANESGGYGMLIGPKATRKEQNQFAKQIRANPRNYMAQPMLNLSTAPTLIDTHAEPRHLDLRPFILSGASHYVSTGGLTRVAMRKGSIVVNSSQGGGSKDTWVIDT
ncbi:MAG: circularly permuted type 2 ATP-grasp protein [Gammaproteobacteria bacterium]|nr:circularly permuted type 2 ATP-grasp protein [Gammaproteobacteria bacterium]